MATTAFTKLEDPPYGYQELGPHIAIINNDEFTTVAAGWHEYKYSATTNQWTKLSNRVDVALGCTSGKRTNTIYTFNSESIIQKHSLKNKTLVLLAEYHPINQLNFDRIAKILLIEDQLHLIGVDEGGTGNGGWYYAVMDNSAERVIKGPLPIRHTKHIIHFLSKAVFLQSKRSIIAYGMAQNGISMICEYSLASNEWIVRETSSLRPHFHGGPAIVVTSDERYIISCGEYEGFYHAPYHNSIVIYDVKKDTFTESDIKFPGSGDVGNAVLMANPKRDELLTFGFVKQCFRDPLFKNMQNLPKYLIQMMAKWFCFETLHLFWNRPRFDADSEQDRSIHWKIDVDDILKVLP